MGSATQVVKFFTPGLGLAVRIVDPLAKAKFNERSFIHSRNLSGFKI